MEEKCIVRKIPAIKGHYGERWYIIKNGTQEVEDFFNMISLWPSYICGATRAEDLSGYELPLGVTLNLEDSLIKHMFDKLGIEIEDWEKN